MKLYIPFLEYLQQLSPFLFHASGKWNLQSPFRNQEHCPQHDMLLVNQTSNYRYTCNSINNKLKNYNYNEFKLPRIQFTGIHRFFFNLD